MNSGKFLSQLITLLFSFEKFQPAWSYYIVYFLEIFKPAHLLDRFSRVPNYILKLHDVLEFHLLHFPALHLRLFLKQSRYLKLFVY